MSINALVISDLFTGLVSDQAAFKFSNDSFTTLENAYVWRNRIKQKDGVETLGRLKRAITNGVLNNTDGSGALSQNILTALTTQTTASVVPGSITVTVGAQSFTEPATPDGTLTNGAGGIGTINYASGAMTIQTAPVLAATPVSITFQYYPGLPVMGLSAFETVNINSEGLIAFDTEYAYEWDDVEFIDASFYKMPAPRNPVVWSGGNYQQFWTTNYADSLWVTNNVSGDHIISATVTGITVANPGVVTMSGAHNLQTGDIVVITGVLGMTEVNGQPYTITVTGANTFSIVNTSGFSAYVSGGVVCVLNRGLASTGDGIRWYDGNATNLGFSNFNPPLQDAALTSTVTFLKGALAILPFKDRLLFFNTVEGPQNGPDVNYKQRCRYSQNGTPYYANSPSTQSATYQSYFDNVPGRGGYIDCPTDETLLAVAENKDVILCFFERSTWRIVYTGNEVLPFIWQKINDTLGIESTFSPVQFDQFVLGFGLTGVHECTTNDIQRIDTKIPNIIFTVKNTDNCPERVSGIIDYFEEIVYWAYADNVAAVDPSFVYNQRVLIYNYRNQSFAILKDTFTTFGYFFKTAGTVLTWGTAQDTWGDANYAWGSSQFQQGYRIVVAGNQKGYVFQLVHNQVANSPQLNIEALSGTTVTVTNHGLEDGDVVYVTDAIGVVGLNDNNYAVQIVDNDTFILLDCSYSGAYLGLGQIARVDKFTIATKQFNLFTQQPISMRVNEIDFYTETTDQGEFVVKLYEGSNSNNAVNDPDFVGNSYGLGGSNSDLVSTAPNQFNPQQGEQQYAWQLIQPSVTGQSLQLVITQDNRQLTNRDIYSEQFILQSLIIYYTSSGRLIS